MGDRIAEILAGAGHDVRRVPAGDMTRLAAGDIARRASAPENHLFGGVVDRSTMSLTERTILRMLRVEDGDYRDWDEIDAWAREAAGEPACTL